MIGRNSNLKIRKIFLNSIRKISPENSLLLPRNRQKTEMISLSYNVNGHVCSKSKSVEIHTDLVNLKVRRILAWS